MSSNRKSTRAAPQKKAKKPTTSRNARALTRSTKEISPVTVQFYALPKKDRVKHVQELAKDPEAREQLANDLAFMNAVTEISGIKDELYEYVTQENLDEHAEDLFEAEQDLFEAKQKLSRKDKGRKQPELDSTLLELHWQHKSPAAISQHLRTQGINIPKGAVRGRLRRLLKPNS
jgi:hypothetical protein